MTTTATATEAAIAGRTNVAAAAPLTPLDLLVGDVVQVDGMTVVVEWIITWDADPAADHSRSWAAGYRPRRVAAAHGPVIDGWDGAPSEWTIQGNDLRPLGYVWR